MREKDLEALLVKRIRKAGGRAYKTISPGQRGFPDRFVVLPGGSCHLIELKTLLGRLSVHQKSLHAELARLGMKVAVIRTIDEIDAWLFEHGML